MKVVVGVVVGVKVVVGVIVGVKEIVGVGPKITKSYVWL